MVIPDRFVLEWDVDALASALKISNEDVIEYFTDGRRVSFIVERRLRDELKWELASSEGAGYDLISPQGQKWEVRSISKRGVYFNPSNQVGSGRSFDEDKFMEKLNEIEGFILADIVNFPEINVYFISSLDVIRWYKKGELGIRAKISRKKFYAILEKEEYG